MSWHRNCEGFSRRDCLQWGLGTLAGGGLANLLRLRAASAATSDPAGKPAAAPSRPTSCILVWLDGGPSHFETFDPKPDAPREIRGELSPIATKLPGVFFSENCRRLATIADKLAIVRSICHDQGNHGAGNHYMMTGAPPRMPVGCGAFVSFHPSLGSVVSHERPAPLGLPSYFSLPQMSRSGGPNFLGARHAPFVVSDDPNQKAFRVRDVSLPAELTSDRFLRRNDLRKVVDRMQRIADKQAADPVAALDTYYGQGLELVGSAQARAAFDLAQEADATRDAYGRTAFGQRCLLARRLVEAGVPFITLYDGGWDHHSDIFSGLPKQLTLVEAALAQLILDLEARDLLDSTLVCCLGEFGRTPKISQLSGRSSPGRDHWSSAMSVLMAGCGIRGGQVIGATDKNGYAPVERRLSPENFASTVYRKLGIDPDKVLYTPQGRPSHLVSDPTPIAELMS